ncbi:MAG: hypothetical protein A2Y65_11070 [Deltaproteobacteria bacterium RBG_13_52_11]|nr:MAG: hypothetical protein A2Y65_11070 [Deltaproteobacteria bacterium RBG_13_52_11]
MEKTVQGNFLEILKKVLAEMPEGKIDFLGPTDEFVSVIFIGGDILLVDSTWGTGNDELQRIYDWEAGTCIIKDITGEERKVLETTWQRPVILEQVKKETKAAISLNHSVVVRTLFQDFKHEPFVLNAFFTEIQEEKYSGEARITTPEGSNRILFYQGQPLLSSNSKSITIGEVAELMNAPGATLSFYLLGDELAHAFLSVLQGETVWQGLSITILHLDKMLNKLMEKNPTGHLCIHKENGDRHYIFFFQGKPLGTYDIEKHWSPVDISTIWENAKHVDYYLSGKIESFVSTAVTTRMSEDLLKLIPLWDDLIEGIAKKLGKKLVEKSLHRNFGGLDFYALEGISLKLVGERNQDAYDALEAFKTRAPNFLKEMETIIGSHWLNERLQAFKERNGNIIGRLSLIEVFSQKGG